MTGQRVASKLDLAHLWRRLLGSEYLVLYLSLAYFLAVLPFAPELATPSNLGNILSAMLPLLAIALGQTFVLITAGIDLSVGSIVSLASVTGGLIMSGQRGLLGGSAFATPAGLLAMLLVGLAIGLVNGATVTRFNMPPFMVTLTTMMFFDGFALWLTQSRKIGQLPESFTAVGRILVWSFLVVSALGGLAQLALGRSLFGRWLYAVGHNPTAAFISGVPARGVILSAYVVSGLCAAVGSVLYTGRLETGDPDLGKRILLDVIGATVIGGTSLYGGKGKVLWTVFGVLFLTLLDNSLNLLNLSHFSIMMVKGGVILLAAVVDTARNRLLADAAADQGQRPPTPAAENFQAPSAP